MIYFVRQRGWFPPDARMRDSHESGGHHELAGKRDALMPPNPEELPRPAS